MNRKGRGSETSRMSLTVPVSTKEAIAEWAQEIGVSELSAANHFLKLGMTAEAIAYAGGKIIAFLENGDQRVLADQNGNYFQRLPRPVK